MLCVYKGTGGLIHMLCGLVYCINWCRRNKAKLIIDVEGHKCFMHKISDYFIINDFTNYSETYDNTPNLKFKRMPLQQVIDTRSVEVDRGNGNFTHYYMIGNVNIRNSLDNYDYSEKLRVYAGPGEYSFIHMVTYLKIKPSIMEIIKNYGELNNYVGVHFRNTDRHNNIDVFIKAIQRQKYKNIYLATDDATAYDKFKNALPNYNIIQYTKPKDGQGKPIHYIDDDKHNLIMNLLIDIYYLYNSNDFIPSGESLVSKLINHMRKTKNTIF